MVAVGSSTDRDARAVAADLAPAEVVPDEDDVRPPVAHNTPFLSMASGVAGSLSLWFSGGSTFTYPTRFP
jgi:hypothetical protein